MLLPDKVVMANVLATFTHFFTQQSQKNINIHWVVFLDTWAFFRFNINSAFSFVFST